MPSIRVSCCVALKDNRTKQAFNTKHFFSLFSDVHINDYQIDFIYTSGMNVIGLVTCACIAGVAMSSMHGRVPILLAFFTEMSALMMKITTWVIFVSPIGIFCLTVSQIIEMENLHEVAEKLSLYLITVVTGILFHGFVVLPTIFYVFTRQNPYIFIVRMGQAIVMAFGTASRLGIFNALSIVRLIVHKQYVLHLIFSSATLPVSIQCLEEKNKVNPQVSRFMLPIGMDKFVA